jgi:GNAT superfamily N-acetyltransferase
MAKMETENFEISTDPSRLDIDLVHNFLTTESYWALKRTREQTLTAVENSLCFGVFLRDEQVAFARVISDFATFAYIGDVFVLERFRGRGISKMLMGTVVSHPQLQNLRRWLLATRDAHGLYSQFGFAELRFPERWMEKSAPDAY